MSRTLFLFLSLRSYVLAWDAQEEELAYVLDLEKRLGKRINLCLDD